MRFSLLLLSCPFISGCLAFAYPTVDRTPRIAVPEAPDEVRAFRVTHGRGFHGAMIAGAFVMNDHVEQVPLRDSFVPPQQAAAVNYIFLAFPIAAFSDFSSMELRLYRPGFEVETKSPEPWWRWWRWYGTHEIQWKQAPDFLTQEKAIDGIVEGVRRVSDDNVRHFLAAEYRRVAALPELAVEEGEVYRVRLLEKARKLEER